MKYVVSYRSVLNDVKTTEVEADDIIVDEGIVSFIKTEEDEEFDEIIMQTIAMFPSHSLISVFPSAQCEQCGDCE